MSSAHHGKIGELSLTSLYTLAEAAQRSLERRLQHGVGGAALLERRPARRQIALEAGARHFDAAAAYEEELTDVFGASLDKAVRRRRSILAVHADNRTPKLPELRRTWIAYPEYWAA